MTKSLFFLLLFCSIKAVSQSAGGTFSFPSATAGYTSALWEVDYSIALAPGEGKGIVWFHTKNPRLSFTEAAYKYENKTYTPSDLGLSSWPSDTREPYLYVDVVINYKGQTVRSLPSYLIVDYPLKLGSFVGGRSTEDKTMTIGGINIPFDSFSVNDFTATLGGDTYKSTITQRNSEIEKLIAKRKKL